jgi:asparagine synthase (glutamine-hydrolysing)
MCGIFGLVSAAGCGIDPALLWSGTHRVRHRGPNDWGFVSLAPARGEMPASRPWRLWEERERARNYRVGLGSRRLSILDLSEAGRQPMNLPGTDLWVVFNGEIYNYLELRSELAPDRLLSTGTDTEVLLAAYERWGVDCLRRFNGMFAFAVWDGSRRRLFLARDRFGEKPLYYLRDRGRFVFASELKQFLEDHEFDREMDRSALADFLLSSFQDHDERTFFRQVKQLLPAHWMEFDVDTGMLNGPHRYWMPEIASDLDTSHDRAFEEKVRFLLENSIRLRLRSDVRMGVCLSGGLDSTTICSLAASQVQDPASLSAYTMAFPGHPEDESKLAARAANRSRVRHVEGVLDAPSVWEQLHEFVYFQDGPTRGVSNLASWQIFKTARADGAIVLLNGQGGDELLAGYDKFYFFWLQILLGRGHWLHFATTSANYLHQNGLSKWNYADGRRYFPAFLRKKTVGMWQVGLPAFRKDASTNIDISSGASLNQRLWKDLSQLSLPCLLHWEDRNSMAAGTEARLPFLDHRLAEAVLATSAYTKLKNGFTKHSLRRAMAELLPAEVCWAKKKRGFDTPAKGWFKTDLAPEMKGLFSKRDAHLSEFLDMRQVLYQYEAFQQGEMGCLTEYDLFRLVGTEIWLQQTKSPLRFPELAPAYS